MTKKRAEADMLLKKEQKNETTGDEEKGFEDLLAISWNQETKKEMADELQCMGLGRPAIERILFLKLRKKP